MHNTAWGDDMARKPNRRELTRLVEEAEMEKLAEAEEWEILNAKANSFIKKFRNEAVGYFYRGTAKSKLGRHKEAIKDYDKAIGLDLNNPHLYNYRGILNDNLGRYAAADVDFAKALEIKPDFEQAKQNRTDLTIKREEVKKKTY